MNMQKLMRALVTMLLFASAGSVVAIDTQRAFDDPALQARYEHINRELRCLVCQNQTIADSNATLAQDLRKEVRAMIAAGKSDDDIREFMIERYGDFVLYRPRMTATNFVLWAAPVLLLLFGAFAVFRYIRKQAGEAAAENTEADQS
jgi:cytochrome c-type biogenesis protein CcmH